MIRILTLAIALALALHSTVTISMDVPQSSKFDSRIQHVDYNAGDVVVIRTVPGISTRVVFSPGETVLDIASGFTQGWTFLIATTFSTLNRNPLKAKTVNHPCRQRPESGIRICL